MPTYFAIGVCRGECAKGNGKRIEGGSIAKTKRK